MNTSRSHWSLSWKNTIALIGIALSPLTYIPLRSWFGEGVAMLAAIPALPFLPIGWIGGKLLSVLAPNPALHLWFYGAGFSIGVFLIAYLCLVNWRYNRAKKNRI